MAPHCLIDMLDPSMAFSVGDTLGDYRITGVLGAGGMGAVYKVQHLISDRTEALKVLLPDLQGNPELAERFLREIRLQAALSHPAIAALHNAFRLENQLLMVMEYVEGESLDAFLRRERLELWAAVEMTLSVLEALSYAHSRGIIHRDIKPANVMLTSQNTVKLMDFGIARLSKDHHITQTGMALGSLYYMSPEQVRGTEVDARSDLYSMGVLLYEMATGERPIRGDSSYAVMEAHLQKIPRAPEGLNSQIPAILSHAILRALEKNPADRYQSAGEFSATLDDIRRRFGQRSVLKNSPWVDIQDTIPSPAGRRDSARTPEPGSLNRSVYDAQAKHDAPVKEATPPTPPSYAGGLQTPRFLFDPERLEKVKRDLAAHIGPVARLLVERTAKKAGSWKQLYEILGNEIPAGKDRDRFLASRPTNF